MSEKKTHGPNPGVGCDVIACKYNTVDCRQRQLAHYTEYDRLFTVDKVELIPGFVFLSSLKLLEAGSLGKSYCLGNSLALGLSSIKESLVVLAEFGSLCNLFILQQEPCVLVV